jgi:hypothetical protein
MVQNCEGHLPCHPCMLALLRSMGTSCNFQGCQVTRGVVHWDGLIYLPF